MKLQFEETAVRVLKSALQDTKLMELTQEVKLSDAMPDIGRALTSWAQIQLRSKEWSRGQLQVTGGVSVHTLYVPEDGSEPRCSENWIPFQMNWSVDPELREGGIMIFPLVRFADSRAVSSRKLMLRIGIGLTVQALSPEDVHPAQSGEVPEDVQLLTGRYPLCLPKEMGEKTFLLDEEIPIPGTIPKPEKLLVLSLTPSVTEARVLGDKLAFRGRAGVHMVYRCEAGKIRSWDTEQPFSQIAQLDGSYGEDSRAVMVMALTSQEQLMEESGNLRLKAGLVGQYLVEERQMVSVTEDAYSPFRNIELTDTSLEVPVILEDRTQQLRAVQTLNSLSGQIADVSFYPDFPVLRGMGEQTALEMSGVFQVLSYGEDEALASASVRWEDALTLPSDESVRLVPLPAHDGAPSASPTPEGTQLSADTQLRLISYTRDRLPMVTALELGPQQMPDGARPTFILTRPGEESLWEIAKRCGSTVDAIQSANRLTNEPVGNPMLLIPVC